MNELLECHSFGDSALRQDEKLSGLNPLNSKNDLIPDESCLAGKAGSLDEAQWLVLEAALLLWTQGFHLQRHTLNTSFNLWSLYCFSLLRHLVFVSIVYPFHYLSIYTSTWEISEIWLAESSGISAKFQIPACENYRFHDNQYQEITSSHNWKKKMRERVSDFQIWEIQELKENLENKNNKKKGIDLAKCLDY